MSVHDHNKALLLDLFFIVRSGSRWGGGKSGNGIGLGGRFIGPLVAPWLGFAARGRPVFTRYAMKSGSDADVCFCRPQWLSRMRQENAA